MSKLSPESGLSPIPNRFVHDGVLHAIFSPTIRCFNALHGDFPKDLLQSPRRAGGENLRSIQGAAMLAMHHTSMLDPLAMSVVAWQEAQMRVNMVAKPELWKVPVVGKVVGWALDSGGTFSIDRKKALSSEKADYISEIIDRDGIVGIFPRGTRKKDGDPNEVDKKALFPGVAVIALRHGMPVHPVGIAGTRKDVRGPIAIAVGKAIEVPQLDFSKVDPSRPSNPMREVIRAGGGQYVEALMEEIHAGMQDQQDIAAELKARDL